MDTIQFGFLLLLLGVSDGTSTLVRLVGDTNNSTGRLEIFSGGEWNMIESSYLTEQTAQVVCRMLGYGNSGVAVELKAGLQQGVYGIYGHGSGRIFSQSIGCTGSENDLSECSNGYALSSMYLSPFNSNIHPAAISCEGSTIRLVDGDTNTSGRVEIFIMGDWHTVCDNGFDTLDARVICRMAGHGDTGIAIPFSYSAYGQGYGAPVLTNLNCQGDEKDVKLCGGSWANNCNHRNDAGVKCGGTGIRLADGPDSASGRVEIKHAGQWGLVCGNSRLDHRDVMVICGMLGYNNTNAFGFGTAFYGEGVGPIIATYPVCDGSESDIAQCGLKWQQPNTISCDHSNSIGVNCNGKTTVRLVGGNSDQSGRLEVFHNNHWGTVGSSGFDNHDLMVVCKMLGFEYTENSFYKTNGFYGEGIGEVVVNNIGCNGNENDIGQCQATWWPATKLQNHFYDVGVSCDGHLPVRLVDGHTNASGRVEVMHGGHYGTICDQGFTRRDLIVLCRMLGYNNIPPTANWHTGAYYGEGLGELVLSDLNCNGIESSIGMCPSTWPADAYYCTHAQDVSLNCDGVSETLRLIGGPTNYTGRVEILHNGEWGRVCDNEFERADAVVLCRILGFKNPETAIAYRGSKYGNSNGTAVLSALHCNGLENTLEQCKALWKPSAYNCYSDVGVNCCPACSSVQIVG